MGHIGRPSEANLILVTTGAEDVVYNFKVVSHVLFQITPKFHLEAITPAGMKGIPNEADVYKFTQI